MIYAVLSTVIKTRITKMKIANYQETLFAWLAAVRTKYLGMAAVEHCESCGLGIDALFQASRKQLAAIGLSDYLINSILKSDASLAERDLVWCQQNKVDIITWDHPDYPDMLREIPDSPMLLFAKGNLNVLKKKQVAIVGARRATRAACETAKQFAGVLVDHGCSVVSGLAAGIDSFAHQGACEKQRESTVAVMGTGLQTIYPRQSRAVANTLLDKGGLLLTEFPPGAEAHRLHFPRRNRIVSGLSKGVLVVEAAKKSGSLITAQFALEQGREVFAIPGNINNPMVEGCHQLIQEGATLVERPEDICEMLFLVKTEAAGGAESTPVTQTQDEHEQSLLQHIDYQPTSLAQLAMRTELSVEEIQSLCLMLELKGKIRRVPGGYER